MRSSTASGSWYSLWQEPRPAYPEAAGAGAAGRLPLFLLSLLLLLVLLGLRSWENLIHPSLFVEDSTHYFNAYYGGHRELGFILQRPHGYYNLLNNLVAWLASHADVRLQPALYQLFAVTLAVTTSCSLAFSGLFRSRWTRMILPAVLGLSGMNHIAYYTTLTFQMYVAVVLLLCLMFLPAPRSIAALAVAVGVLSLLIWSGPYSVVAVPVALLFILLFRNGRRTAVLGWVIVCTLVYAQTARGLVRLENLTDPEVVRKMVQVLFENVFFLNLLGPFAYWKAALFLCLLGAAVYGLRKEEHYLRFSVIFLAIIGGALAPLFLSSKFVDYPDPYPCHTFISQFFWLAFLLYSADQLVRRSSRRRSVGWVVVGAFALVVVVDNARHPGKGHLAIREGLPEFLAKVHRVEELDLEERNQYVIMELRGYDRHFVPRVRIGSRREDAQQVRYEDLELGPGVSRGSPAPPAAPGARSPRAGGRRGSTSRARAGSPSSPARPGTRPRRPPRRSG